MTSKKLLKLSALEFTIAAFTFIVNYFFYHFVTDEGITLVFHAEPGKPFVALLIGVFATLFLFSAIITLLLAFVICDKNKK